MRNFILTSSFAVNVLLAVVVFKSGYIGRKIDSLMYDRRFYDAVVVGDSITASPGRRWNALLNCSVVASATPGFSTYQIAYMSKGLDRFKPRMVFLLAGTNDCRQECFDGDCFSRSYEKILKELDGLDVTVSLLPYQENSVFNDNVDTANKKILELQDRYGFAVVDLNSLICDGKSIKPSFTTDGIHLTDAAYDVWAVELKKHIK